MLRERTWQLRYTSDDGNLLRLFYIPALEDATRYHRLTGYFNAGALALAARGIEGLVRNNGQMQLLVGCTLNAEEIAAIEHGLRMAGMADFVRVTTDPTYFEAHAESVELWSPGSAVFRAPEGVGEPGRQTAERLRDILRREAGAAD